MNVPHNPTGGTISVADFHIVMREADKRGVYVFCDEMYKFLEHNEDCRLPSGCDVYAKAITLNGMSKSFAMPGLRLGWLATQDSTLLQAFATLKDYTTICPPAPSEILAAIALHVRATKFVCAPTVMLTCCVGCG